jgi:hypothetical protein
MMQMWDTKASSESRGVVSVGELGHHGPGKEVGMGEEGSGKRCEPGEGDDMNMERSGASMGGGEATVEGVSDPQPCICSSERGHDRKHQASAGNWVGPGQPGPSPSCFVPNGFGPGNPKKLLDRVVRVRSVKNSGPAWP